MSLYLNDKHKLDRWTVTDFYSGICVKKDHSYLLIVLYIYNFLYTDDVYSSWISIYPLST